jgi:hypothetical protein
MGKIRKNLTGEKVGKLSIGEIDREVSVKGRTRVYYNCTCECGITTSVPYENLIDKVRPTRSCGCLKVDVGRKVNTKHGQRKSRVYNIWCNMKSRCQNTNDHAYTEYGEAGITVCDRWQTFENFLEDMGFPDEFQSINRVEGTKN